MNQTTIATTIHCTGTGLHSGKQVSLTMSPASADNGIIFIIDTPKGIKRISPRADAVTATQLATTLGTAEGSISTVEHLLATLRGLEIDNVVIKTTGGELPILDGSAALFVTQIQEAGIRTLGKPRQVLRIKKPFEIQEGIASIKALPYTGFCVDYTINFPHPAIGEQFMSFELTPKSFAQIANSRTFGFLEQVEYLRNNGLALGGDLTNAIVLDKKGVLNPEGLRHKDEFVRHKILDFIGDMAMLPLPLQGRFIVSCSGHALNNQLLRALSKQETAYLEAVTLQPKQPTKKFITSLLPQPKQAAATA